MREAAVLHYEPMPLGRINVFYGDLAVGSIMPEVPGFPRVVWSFEAHPISIKMRRAANEVTARAEILRTLFDWFDAKDRIEAQRRRQGSAA